MPSKFEDFSNAFLDPATGRFSDNGKEQFVNHMNGVVSYLDRSRDAREFAQPQIELVKVRMSERPVANIEMLKKNLDKEVAYLKGVIKELEDSYVIFKKSKMQQYKDEIKQHCGSLKGQDYLDCKNNPTPFMSLIAQSIVKMGSKIEAIKAEHNEEIKRMVAVYNAQRALHDNSIAQEHVVETRCLANKVSTKKQGANASNASNAAPSVLTNKFE